MSGTEYDKASSVSERRAWYMYDFANSAFPTTVVTLFLGPYLTALARSAAGASGYVYPFGVKIDARSYWSYLISLSVLSQVVCLPVVGALADSSPNKKRLLGFFAYLGAATTAAMFWLADGQYLLGGLLFLAANLAFGASVVIYNSFLNDIAPPQQRDAASATGWGIGYLGGGLLLGLNLLLYTNAGRWGLDEALAVRISLGSAGLWWALFTLFPMRGLRRRVRTQQAALAAHVWWRGFVQFYSTLRDLRRYPQAVTFLLAYLLYNDAVQAVITLAGQFGADYLGMPMELLTMAILMVQFLAFGWAMLFKVLAARLGGYRSLVTGLVVWTALMGGVFWVQSARDFFIAAAVVALVMGGTQALSRSLFSVLIPQGREAEYFSLYEISDKGTSWLAPLLFGLTLQATGSYQWAILSLLVFFVLGLFVIGRVDMQQGAREAGNLP